MENLKNIPYGGIIRNSLFEKSSNPGETYNIYEILAPSGSNDTVIDDNVDNLSESIKELYSVLRA